jgi:hypothetical protein
MGLVRVVAWHTGEKRNRTTWPGTKISLVLSADCFVSPNRLPFFRAHVHQCDLFPLPVRVRPGPSRAIEPARIPLYTSTWVERTVVLVATRPHVTHENKVYLPKCTYQTSDTFGPRSTATSPPPSHPSGIRRPRALWLPARKSKQS